MTQIRHIDGRVIYEHEGTVREAVMAAVAAGADLRGAHLGRANLTGAHLGGAYLRGANLRGADLADATLPDGRTWEVYRADPLAGICDEPEARARAIAAWGKHEWGKCPMSVAHGWSGFGDVPEDRRIVVAAFVAVFDSRLLVYPE